MSANGRVTVGIVCLFVWPCPTVEMLKTLAGTCLSAAACVIIFFNKDKVEVRSINFT